MRVTFCGTGAGPFTGERASSGLVLQHDGRTVMLDCGPGSVRGTMQAGIALRDVEAVILSHLHSDHVLDLAALPFQEGFGVAPIPPIYGPPGTVSVAAAATSYLDGIRAAAAAHRGEDFPVRRAALAQATEIAGSDEREIGGFAVRSAETPHAPDVIAAVRRLSIDGKAIVFSGDTQPNPGTFVPLSEGVDLLIHECYNEEQLQRTVARMPAAAGERLYAIITSTHTEVLHAAAIARDAGVRRLALTHIGRNEDVVVLRARAATVFAGGIVVAQDGLTLDV